MVHLLIAFEINALTMRNIRWWCGGLVLPSMVSSNYVFALEGQKKTATAATTTHKRSTTVKKFTALVNSYTTNNKKMKTSEWRYPSCSETGVYCYRPAEIKTRLQALSALSTHLVYYPCAQTTNTTSKNLVLFTSSIWPVNPCIIYL